MNFHISDMQVPFVAAPMAGGISTPALAAATGGAGGLGFLAAGYQSALALQEQIDEVRTAVDWFGVNVFVPDTDPGDLDLVAEYRARLLDLAQELEVELPDPRADDDAWTDKLTLLLDDPVPVVSFTFGCPTAEVVKRLHAAGSSVWVTVTSADDAALASGHGVDCLVVQGPEAGGHRATFEATTPPPGEPLAELVNQVRSRTDTPLVAAGGLTTPGAVAAALGTCAAVQVGTGLLDVTEAGTSPAYRAALRDPSITDTVVTRAFSGRPARGLRNRFIEEFDPYAPSAYPAVNQVTSPLRRAAASAGRYEYLSLWAGTAWRSMPTGRTDQAVDALLSHA